MANDEGRVTRDSFEGLAVMASPAAVPALARLWSDGEWTRVRAGHVTQNMDDKWNAFVERDRLFLHRSWTGRGVYEARFTRTDTHWRITEAVVENDPRSYRRGSDETESLCLELIIESVLLHRFRQREWQRWRDTATRDLLAAGVPPGRLYEGES